MGKGVAKGERKILWNYIPETKFQFLEKEKHDLFL